MSTTAAAPADQGGARTDGRGDAPTPGRRRRRRARRNLVVAIVLGAVLLVLMVAVTPFKTAAQVKALNPPPFAADAYVAKSFPRIVATITQEATPITTLAPAVDADPAAAGKEYGLDAGSGSFTFAVSARGTVASVDANFAVLTVAGLPEGDVVRVPLGGALNGTPVRDAAGLAFGDFPGQTEFQNVANELKKTMTTKVLQPADLAGKQGQQVSVVGAYATGGPPKSFIVQPVSIEAGP